MIAQGGTALEKGLGGQGESQTDQKTRPGKNAKGNSAKISAKPALRA